MECLGLKILLNISCDYILDENYVTMLLLLISGILNYVDTTLSYRVEEYSLDVLNRRVIIRAL